MKTLLEALSIIIICCTLSLFASNRNDFERATSLGSSIANCLNKTTGTDGYFCKFKVLIKHDTHPPNGKEKPGTYSGQHSLGVSVSHYSVDHWTEWQSIYYSSVSQSWSVEDKKEVPWILDGINSSCDNIKMSLAYGSIKGDAEFVKEVNVMKIENKLLDIKISVF